MRTAQERRTAKEILEEFDRLRKADFDVKIEAQLKAILEEIKKPAAVVKTAQSEPLLNAQAVNEDQSGLVDDAPYSSEEFFLDDNPNEFTFFAAHSVNRGSPLPMRYSPELAAFSSEDKSNSQKKSGPG